MDLLFAQIVKMSLMTTILISIILLVRLLFTPLRRRLLCVLWEIALLKFVIPLSIPFQFGILPNQENLSAHSGADIIQVATTNSFWPASALTIVWVSGIAGMLIYQLLCAVKIKKITCRSILWKENIYLCKETEGAFVAGCVKPKIYLPADCDESMLALILAHEKAHIAWHDNLKKLLAWTILSIHWFNPFAWLAYILFCKDIELACDERVIAGAGKEMKKQYAYAILRQSLGANYPACTSFFGRSAVRGRIKRVMQYRETGRGGRFLAVVLCLSFLLFAATERFDLHGEIVSSASAWFMDTYGESYEVKNLHAEVIRTWKDKEEIRYTVSLTCETMPKFDHVDDPALAADANFGQWEELTTEIVVMRARGTRGNRIGGLR